MNIDMRKIIFFSIFIITAAFTSVGCASKKVELENQYDYVEPKINPRTKKPFDFNGINIVIADWYTDPDVKPKTVEARNLKEWNDWSNKTYNMNVQRKMLWGPAGYFEMVKNYCVEGYVEEDDYTNYVFVIDESIAQQGVKGNLFYDLSTVKAISYFDSVKYNISAVNRLKRGRSFYSFGWEKDEPLCGVYFNKRILQEHGYTSEYLYDLQLEGKWTWDVFEKLCKKFTKDTDYDGDTDIWAMSSDIYDFASLCLDSNDTALVQRDINGNYYSNVIDSKTMEAFYWMIDIWEKHQYPKKENDPENYYYKPFIDGKTAFFVGHQNSKIAKSSFEKMNDDYGFICFPAGPRGTGVYRTLSNPKMVVIPSWYDSARVERIAKALDLWLTPVPNNSMSDAWKKNYSGLYRDARANDETLQLMGATPNPRFDVLIKDFPAKSMYYNILNQINTPEEEHFFTKIGIEMLLDDTNRYITKVNTITEEELQEYLEDELSKIKESYDAVDEDSEETITLDESEPIDLMAAFNEYISEGGVPDSSEDLGGLKKRKKSSKKNK